MPRQNAIALGEFEQLVLLAVLSLGDAAYAVPVRREIQRATQRTVTRGAVYITLDRLEQKGLLTSVLGESLPERGGRARRYYRATPVALAALRRHRASLDRMWAAADAALRKA
jgi:DNA-binding PadR family transcriptional regulator